MSYATVTRNPAWYTEALKWIGSRFIDAGNALETPRDPYEGPLEPQYRAKPIDELLYDARFRMQMWGL